MLFLRQIVQTYVRPAAVMDRKLGVLAGEEKLLGYLLAACFLSFLGGVPVMLAQARLEGVPPGATFAAGLVATMVFAPLFLYALAALSHLAARAFGGQGGWRQARLALFWPLLALQPLAFALKLLPGMTVVNILAGVYFLWIWLMCLRVAEFGAGRAA